VILGGRGKAEPYDGLAAAVCEGDQAYLIGESASELASALDARGVPYVLSKTLERSLVDAAQAASTGDVVLLSPACASFDQFTSFEHRGEEFRRLVEKLPGWGTGAVPTGGSSSSGC
jgi:UDP-N-acetylmuramoylalanine--D-glutamate ligase